MTKIMSKLEPMSGGELHPDDLIEVSHVLNGVKPYEYVSRSITFKELCEAVEKQLKFCGAIPYEDE